VRAVWLEGAASNHSAEGLAASHEAQVARADAIADRMFSEHERVARRAALRAEQARGAEAAEAGELELEAARAREAELERAWRGAWAPAGLEPLPPREMRSWAQRQRRLVELLVACDELRRQAALLEGEIERHHRACWSALEALGESPRDRAIGVGDLLERAERCAAAIDAVERKRARHDEALAEALQEQREREQELGRVERDQDRWRVEWREALAPLQLEPDASPEEASTALQSLEGIFRKRTELAGLIERIEHIDRDTRDFEAFLDELLRDTEVRLPERSALERSAMLLERLGEAREARAQRRTLEKRIREIDEERDDQQALVRAADGELAALMQRADCEALPDLERAEERSDEARRLAAQLADVEQRLRRAARPVEELAALAADADAEKLALELEQLRAEIEGNESQMAKWSENVGMLRSALAAMDGGAAAAEEAFAAEQALAKVGSLVGDYARLRLAHLVLAREMQRYGAEHQGPVLARASELFTRMTRGSFAGVTSDFGSDDEMLILCERPQGLRLRVEQLSDGARDQLYLSLRLAALEHHLDRSEPIPLIVDDVLVSFDDPRASATFELLAELSRRTQILFFTHHERLVELARAAIPESQLVVHTL